MWSRCDEAADLFRDVAERSERVLGAAHPNTVGAKRGLAQCLQGMSAEAQNILQGMFDEALPAPSSMKPGALKAELARRGVDTRGMLEKQDLVEALEAARARNA